MDLDQEHVLMADVLKNDNGQEENMVMLLWSHMSFNE